MDTSRKIILPSQVILSDGKTEKVFTFATHDTMEYLKICIDLNLYYKDGCI